MLMKTSRQLGNQLVMDGTCETNNLGKRLFTVLLEVDGSGLLIGYYFLRKTGQDNTGTTSAVLAIFLCHVGDVTHVPIFFGIDQGNSKISAILSVWPGIKLNLCVWYVKRAILSKTLEAKEN